VRGAKTTNNFYLVGHLFFPRPSEIFFRRTTKGDDMSIQSHLIWTGDMQFVARSGQGPAIVIDNPDGGSGPSPMELVLTGVAGCTAMDVVSILRKKRVDLLRFEVMITGLKADTHPKRYTHIDIEYIINGKNISQKAVEQAITLSTEKYCSAIASMNATTNNRYRIIESEKSD
jgi:putative redox protein